MIHLFKRHHRKAILSAPIVFLFSAPNALPPGNSVYVSASNIAPEIGKSTSVIVRFNATAPVNAFDGSLHVDPSRITLGMIDTNKSALNLWAAAPETNSESGTVAWSGGIIDGPGKGPMNGEILRANITPLTEGLTKILVSDATLLANDGKGTNIIDNLGALRITPRQQGTASPDIDTDGRIDIRDITAMIDQVMGFSPASNDLTGDKKVNFSDLDKMMDFYQAANNK
jgi:hypothetical protein